MIVNDREMGSGIIFKTVSFFEMSSQLVSYFDKVLAFSHTSQSCIEDCRILAVRLVYLYAMSFSRWWTTGAWVVDGNDVIIIQFSLSLSLYFSLSHSHIILLTLSLSPHHEISLEKNRIVQVLYNLFLNWKFITIVGFEDVGDRRNTNGLFFNENSSYSYYLFLSW